MNFNRIFPLTFLIIFLLTSCATTDVNFNTRKGDNIDFASYKTFYVLPEPTTEDNPYPTLVKSFPRRTVEDAVLYQLKLRNYKQIKDKDSADMLVAIQFSLKDEERTYTTNNTSYRNTNYRNSRYDRYGYGNRYGYGYRNYYGYQTFSNSSTIVQKYRRGNMIIDLIDRKENTLIWEAFAQGKGETELDAIDKKINKVVSDVFSKYPILIDESNIQE